MMYDKGFGVVPNKVVAYAWYTLSAESGYKEGLSAVGQLEKELSPGQIEEGKRKARKIKRLLQEG